MHKAGRARLVGSKHLAKAFRIWFDNQMDSLTSNGFLCKLLAESTQISLTHSGTHLLFTGVHARAFKKFGHKDGFFCKLLESTTLRTLC